MAKTGRGIARGLELDQNETLSVEAEQQLLGTFTEQWSSGWNDSHMGTWEILGIIATKYATKFAIKWTIMGTWEHVISSVMGENPSGKDLLSY